MSTYRLGSSAMIHTPGILAWAINGYHFDADRPQLLKVLSEGFPTVPQDAFDSLLRGATPYRVEDETVIFTYEAA